MPKIDPVAVVDAALAEGVELRQQLRKDAAAIAAAGAAISAALAGGGKLLVCGNGGSAADAQHIAAELVGRFSGAVRPALAAMALTTDTSALTAIAHDLRYDHLFPRPGEALRRPPGGPLPISTPPRSPP